MHPVRPAIVKRLSLAGFVPAAADASRRLWCLYCYNQPRGHTHYNISATEISHFGGRGGRRGSSLAPFERATVVSYRLSIVTVVLSVTIQPQFSIECLRR